MYRKKISLFFSLFTLIYACSHNSGHKSPDKVGSSKIVKNLSVGREIDIDSFLIQSSYIKGNLGGSYCTYFINYDTAYIVLEDCENNKIDIYNLTSYRSHSIYLSSQGELCKNSHNYSFVSPTHFFMLNSNGVLEEYKDSKLVKSMSLNENEILQNLGLAVPSFLKKHNEIKVFTDSLLYFPVEVNPDLHRKLYSNSNYNYPISAILNLKNNSVTIYGIKYPKYLYENNFGLLNEIRQNYAEGKIIYSFKATSEIWRFESETDSLSQYIVKSKYDKVPTQPINFKRTPETKDLLWQHSKTNPHYQSLVYDPFRKVYYRFYGLPLPEKNSNGFYSTNEDRRYSVMILDEEFNILAEQMLPDACFFIFFAIPTKDGLYINHGPIINPVKYGIKILKISLEDN